MIFWFALLATLLPFVSAFRRLHPRTQETCGKFDVVTVSPYSLMTNLWGSSNGEGWQCAAIYSVNDNVVRWSTNYSWWESHSIMSFTNIQLNDGLNQQLSSISSMPSEWKWTQSDGEVVADIAYDFFTSYSPDGSNAIEVMVWLANMNAGPISYHYDESDNAVPIVSDLDINEHKWNLYCGTNGYNVVYSFLPAGGDIRDWSSDMYAFFSYLMDNHYIDSSQYLTIAQAGTEVTSGAGTFETSAYSLYTK